MFAILALAQSAAAGAIVVTATATCPGPTDILVTGATPGGDVIIVSGDAPGSTIIPAGPCAGRDIGLSGSVKVRKTVAADPAGTVSLSPDLPAPVCGSWIAALDTSTCSVTRAVELASGGPVGAFDVNSGPGWSYNPPTYTCLEACAMIFGGASTDYTCSTDSAAANGRAYGSTWGVGESDPASYCIDPGMAEDYKLNTYYNCGYTGCSVSAYVQDNCFSGNSINHCFN